MTERPERRPPDLAQRLDALAAEDVEGVLAAARAGARERARVALEDALVERLVARAAKGEAAAPPVPPASGAPPEGDAIYLYGVVRAADAAGLGSVPGLRGPVETVVDGGLAAIVSVVPLGEFGDEQLKANLERMEWLEPTARGHEEAIAAVGSEITIVPMRLCTVFHDHDAVRGMLRQERDVLADALTRLDGRTEWGVKVLADPARVIAALEAETRGEDADGPVSEGRGYLAARRREQQATRSADDRLRVAVRDVHETLAGEAEAALRNPVQSPELSGHEGEMLLNGVYLVDDDRAERFFARLDELAARHAGLGLDLQRTGPWPPYNFVSAPDAA